MTAILTLMWAASKAMEMGQPAPHITNPLPVMKGQIGRGTAKPKAVVSGFAPLNPTELPGVLFALRAQNVVGQPVKVPQTVQRDQIVQSAPGRQGANNAFNSALDALFGKSQGESSAMGEGETVKPRPRPSIDSGERISQPMPVSPKASTMSRTKEARTAPGTAEARRAASPSAPPLPKAGAVPVTLPPLPKTAVKQTAAAVQKPQPGPTQNSDSASNLITIDVVDLELSKVVQTLSDQTGSNVILLGQTNKTLTIRLIKVSMEDAMTHICAVTALRHLLLGRTYIIATAEELRQAYPKEYEASFPSPPKPVTSETAPQGPPVDPKLDTVEVINLSYVTASEVVQVLKSAFDEKELVSRAGPSQHIPSLSTAETQNVTGVSTGILRADGQEQGAGDGSSSPTSRVVVIRGTKESVQAAKSLALRLDVSRPQVAIAVRILDISDEAMKDLGLTWTFGDQTLSERGGQGIGFRTFDRSAGAILARLSALKKEDQAQILAEPNISVLDNQKAFILIGQRLNFPTLVGYTQANTPIFSPKEEKVGIYLQVSASVSPSEEITMSLYPQVSTVTGFLEVNGASYPQISTREAQTSLRVQSGETIVLGGLIREEEIKNVQKVPLLSEIPILGEFFKKVKTQKTKSQIIISITPTVTRPNAR